MLSISLDPEIERRLSELAKRSGKTEADYARELIEEDIEGLEDLRIAEASRGSVYSLVESYFPEAATSGSGQRATFHTDLHARGCNPAQLGPAVD